MDDKPIGHTQHQVHWGISSPKKTPNNTGKMGAQDAARMAIQALHLLYAAQEIRKLRLATKQNSFVSSCTETWMRCLKTNAPPNFSPPLRIVTTQAIARILLPLTLQIESFELQIMEYADAYRAILLDQADIAIVLEDSSARENVVSTEIKKGVFQLYSLYPSEHPVPIVIPNICAETVLLQERWKQLHSQLLTIRAHLPNFALILDLCLQSGEVGFLPDFLAKNTPLIPVSWQPPLTDYRLLALHRKRSDFLKSRLDNILRSWIDFFTLS